MKIPDYVIKLVLGRAGVLLQTIVNMIMQRSELEHVVNLATLEVAKFAGDTTTSGDDKRAAARQAIVADLKANGKVIADSLVNLGLELAVNALKAQTGKL